MRRFFGEVGDKVLNDGLFGYAYDSANRLTQVVSGTLTTEYLYNGDGVRVAQIENGLRTDYVQDVAALWMKDEAYDHLTGRW